MNRPTVEPDPTRDASAQHSPVTALHLVEATGTAHLTPLGSVVVQRLRARRRRQRIRAQALQAQAGSR